MDFAVKILDALEPVIEATAARPMAGIVAVAVLLALAIAVVVWPLDHVGKSKC